MNKRIILGLFAAILIVSLFGNVDAYWTRRTYYDDCYDFGDCEPRDYGLYVRVGCDGICHDYYDYPRYNYRYRNYYSGYYSGGRWHYGCDDDCKYRRNVRTAIRDVTEEYNEWRYDTYFSTTEELYGSDGEDNPTSTNWRYKPAYNSLDYGDDYYTPVYDSEKGYFNWRY